MVKQQQRLAKSSGSPVLERLDQLEALTYSILADSDEEDEKLEINDGTK